MDDMISRRAAIRWVKTESNPYGKPTLDYESGKKVIEHLEAMPSAQPEIVRCKECKWYELPSHKITENCVKWMKSNGILLPIKPNDYCSYAERRTDATTI